MKVVLRDDRGGRGVDSVLVDGFVPLKAARNWKLHNVTVAQSFHLLPACDTTSPNTFPSYNHSKLAVSS